MYVSGVPLDRPEELPPPYMEIDRLGDVDLYKLTRGEVEVVVCHGEVVKVDYEVGKFVRFLNSVNLCTELSCAGHVYLDERGKVVAVYPPTISFGDPLDRSNDWRIHRFFTDVFNASMVYLGAVVSKVIPYRIAIWYREFDKFYVVGCYREYSSVFSMPPKIRDMIVENIKRLVGIGHATEDEIDHYASRILKPLSEIFVFPKYAQKEVIDWLYRLDAVTREILSLGLRIYPGNITYKDVDVIRYEGFSWLYYELASRNFGRLP